MENPSNGTVALESNASSNVLQHGVPAPTTQRAYTLRLRGADPSDTAWREALWATHEAVNLGAKAFGDWLLTLRGGLDHELAEPPAATGNRPPTEDEIESQRRNRRVLLALSWLSVEDERGAPEGADVRVALGSDSKDRRRERLIEALRAILAERGVEASVIEQWERDCGDSLAANIREDAVWVNRSARFDAAVLQVGDSLTRDEVWDVLEPFFGSRESYLAPVKLTDDEDGGGSDEKPKDLVQSAGQWLSSRFGTGAGVDFASLAEVYRSMVEWADHAPGFDTGPMALADLAASLKQFGPRSADAVSILALISGSGYKSATRNIIKSWVERAEPITPEDIERFADVARNDHESSVGKVGRKGRKPWSDRILRAVEESCGFTYLQESGPARHSEFVVMLDHAARRVSIGHSGIKRAEAERRRFQADADRIEKVPESASRWLDGFIGLRGDTSGALAAGGEYRIRKRAIEGWDQVVKRWHRKGCTTPEARKAAAREVQANPEIEKFGDIQLFEALAADDALCVWQNGGKPNPQILKDYVAGHDAKFKRGRFKVPAYRHPDMLRHPVFCDFGNSRWDVDYALHRRPSGLGDARKKVERCEAAIGKAQASLDKAKTPEKRATAEEKLATRQQNLAEAREALAWLSDPRSMRMSLWTGDALAPVNRLRWSSKRLAADLGLAASIGDGGDVQAAASRGDRLGRAASGVADGAAVVPTGLFEQKEWKARLQAPRRQLEALAAHVERHGWDARTRKMRDNLSWLVTLSAKLECRGPFIEYAAANGIAPNRKGEYYPAAGTNKADGRKGHAKVILSRLPGLRVLSVDLGHRFAAACAVWESLAGEAFAGEIDGREVVAGGAGPQSLYCHTRHTDERGKERTTIYRRIGPDTLADGSPHPAPWARLDRQFSIKLQGEDTPARKASVAETTAVRDFETAIGRSRTGQHDGLPAAVDELMAEAVRSARLGLRRQGDAARIAYAFKPGALQHTPGGGTRPHTPETRHRAVLDALVRWHELRGVDDGRWGDAEVKKAWDGLIAPRLAEAMPQAPEDATGPERKAFRKKIEQALTGLAEELAGHGEAGTPEFFDWWQAKWTRDGERWRAHLKWLSRWLVPRGLRARRGETPEQRAARKSRLGAARSVGGLSLTRIATMRAFWQVQKAYHYGPHPDNPRTGVDRIEADTGKKFGERALRSMERMREQRVKQLASRIAEAALGVGRAPASNGRDRKRPRSRVDAPCHAVVIENLRNYRPDELQTRRENKALMAWSAGKVRKYLEEACQLHGLHLREVSPNYTSRQCSRTGLPGMRCVDVPVDTQTGQPKAYWWPGTLRTAQRDVQGKDGKARSRYIVALAQRLAELKERVEALPMSVRVPRNGGDLFVAAPSWDELRKRSMEPSSTVQADLNAAANIGLRALLDPDFAGRWWYVPCDSKTGKPMKDKCAGAACLDLDAALFEPAERSQRDVTNMWRDPAAGIAGGDGWKGHHAYWPGVEMRVVGRLRAMAGLDAED